MASARPRGLTEAQVEAMIFADSDDEEDDLHDLLDEISDPESSLKLSNLQTKKFNQSAPNFTKVIGKQWS